ncbi:MAG: hypothetical protein U0M02_12550 [Acutalibacteraceae bacterium]|nr:hypothetical protein [Acutalibacteraceae bacterium]
MKKFISILLLSTFLYLSAITVFSADIDGYDKGEEWAGAETLLLLNGESNCNVNFGLIKWIIDSDTNGIYFCVMFKEPDLAADNTNVGASLKIENSDFYTVRATSSGNIIDEDRYSFEGSLSVDSNNGVTCEIRLGLKYGIPDIINGSVRFIDSEGVPSNIYDFSIDNINDITEYHNNHNSDGSDYTSHYKTTTQKPEKTTKRAEKTTKVKSTDSNDDFWILDMFLSDITTKQQTTSVIKSKLETEKNTDKKNKVTTKNRKTSVSETVLELNQHSDKTADFNLSESQPENKISLNLEKGDKYKTTTLIGGVVTLVAISVLGTMKSRKEEKPFEKENDPKS